MNNKETQTEELENLRNNCLTYLCTHFFCLAFFLLAVLGEKRIDTLSSLLMGGECNINLVYVFAEFSKIFIFKKIIHLNVIM